MSPPYLRADTFIPLRRLIGGKWKCVILFHLLIATRRFNELRRLMPDVTQRMLTRQLRELEADKIIKRKVHPEVPPKVEYSLTDFGETLEPLLIVLQQWGFEYLEKISDIRNQKSTDDVVAKEREEVP